MTFNRMRWYENSIATAQNPEQIDIVTTLAFLADEHGYVTRASIEDAYHDRLGDISEFFEGDEGIFLTLPDD